MVMNYVGDSYNAYCEYEPSWIWGVVEKAMDDLIENQDIELTTHRRLVIGYFCKLLFASGKLGKVEDNLK